MKFAIIVLIPVVLLSGCARGVSKGQSLIQPDVQVYSRQQQAQAADEIEGGSCPMLTDMMKDYGVMRDQARAARRAL